MKILGNDEMPPFMREFVMRRSQQHSNPALPTTPPPGGSQSGPGSCENTPTKIRKPTPQIRPQSAFIPPGNLHNYFIIQICLSFWHLPDFRLVTLRSRFYPVISTRCNS